MHISKLPPSHCFKYVHQFWALCTLVERIQDGGAIKSLPLTNRNIDVTAPDYEAIHQMVREAVDPSLRPPAPSTSTTTTTPSPSDPSSSPTTEEPTDELSDITATC